MIYGIGTDIVKVARMQQNLDKWGERFASRILSPRELEEFRASTRQAHFLSKRFAAKEACAKALGTGFRNGLSLPQISVRHTRYGQPVLEYTGTAFSLVQKNSINHSHLSIADEDDYALAFVTLCTSATTISVELSD